MSVANKRLVAVYECDGPGCRHEVSTHAQGLMLRGAILDLQDQDKTVIASPQGALTVLCWVCFAKLFADGGVQIQGARLREGWAGKTPR